MNLLLDTHTFLWWVKDSSNLSHNARSLLEDTDNVLYLSIASIWEIAIKLSLNKLEIELPLHEFISKQLNSNDIQELSIQRHHVMKVVEFPFHHRDPFDRLIIAQALIDSMPIVGKDEIFDAYGVKRLW